MKTGFTPIVVLLVCWAFASGLCFRPAPSSQNCDQYGCVSKKGASCHTSWAQDPSYCTFNQGAECCAIGLECFGGICATNNVGAQCQQDLDCSSLSGQYLGCSNSTCKYLSFVGDFCGDDDTFCDPGLSCVENVCTGQALGQRCNDYLVCNAGLHCSAEIGGTCQQPLEEGGNCANNPGECASGLFCYNANGTATVCTKERTLPVGANCYEGWQCMAGYCMGGVCYEPPEAYTLCTTKTDCSAGQKCECSQFTANSFCNANEIVDPCAGQEANAENCAAEYNCTYLSTNYGSCFSNNCFSQLVALQTCGCQNNRLMYGSCYYSDFCQGAPAALPDMLGFPRLGDNGASA